MHDLTFVVSLYHVVIVVFSALQESARCRVNSSLAAAVNVTSCYGKQKCRFVVELCKYVGIGHAGLARRFDGHHY